MSFREPEHGAIDGEAESRDQSPTSRAEAEQEESRGEGPESRALAEQEESRVQSRGLRRQLSRVQRPEASG